ncbi:MAG: hypothetical protein HZA59_10140 [Hydrogenophilales bacterium]|nr:hypothetical protein [Hydrogenophilales bacterium]
MNNTGHRKMLTIHQTIGLLQRFMTPRNASEWLEVDRRYSPVIPFLQQGEVILYHEDDVVHFIKKLDARASVRAERTRRDADERRHIHRERRDSSDRRYLRHRAAANNLDRRFAVRQDRRSDLDRRIRGWVDRRCVSDRRDEPIFEAIEIRA